MGGALGFLILAGLLLASCGGFGVAEGYKNYTVGDDLGWYDRSEVPKVDYQKWAADKNFSLGDFLIFNTDKKHSVIQTYNATVYRSCDYSDAQDNDTLSFSAGEPTAADKEAVTFAVPLVREGANYFFSGDYDGDQCRNGQQFHLNVTHGQGLPESLQTQAAAASPAPADDDGSVPDTVVPSNFNNPQGVGAVDAPMSGAAGGRIEMGAVSLVLIVCGLTGLLA